MKAKTMSGSEINLDQSVLEGPKMRLRGSMIDPEGAGYEDSRTVCNAVI